MHGAGNILFSLKFKRGLIERFYVNFSLKFVNKVNSFQSLSSSRNA